MFIIDSIVSLKCSHENFTFLQPCTILREKTCTKRVPKFSRESMECLPLLQNSYFGKLLQGSNKLISDHLCWLPSAPPMLYSPVVFLFLPYLVQGAKIYLFGVFVLLAAFESLTFGTNW